MVLSFCLFPSTSVFRNEFFTCTSVGMRHDRIQARIERTPAGAGEVLGRR